MSDIKKITIDPGLKNKLETLFSNKINTIKNKPKISVHNIEQNNFVLYKNQNLHFAHFFEIGYIHRLQCDSYCRKYNYGHLSYNYTEENLF